ncbi:mitochondrial potassium channel ATP-binding subunit isoform X2 [Oryzias melastigma]|uniref:mitochondrial potassium channel ATP-binding subunit isoform X2 n=1 Tax=Oryzias melastigma TaxID=30732 RepID=UPI00168D970B|nr:mitochondrial potassium channel ATP-binding subunit isoform X2 [Oryzias melastigma]
MSLASISILFGQVVRGISSGARVFEYLSLQPSIPLCGGGRIPHHSLMGRVDFMNISFSYPTRPGHEVLNKFNLTLPPSKTIAIVGESGGGKSTVAALLERFYDPSSGVIMLDGLDIRTLDLSWLRGQVIGFINQEPVLFGSSIMENIRFGKPEATDAEVMEASKQANAYGFITSFPDGFNTLVAHQQQAPLPPLCTTDARSEHMCPSGMQQRSMSPSFSVHLKVSWHSWCNKVSQDWSGPLSLRWRSPGQTSVPAPRPHLRDRRNDISWQQV